MCLLGWMGEAEVTVLGKNLAQLLEPSEVFCT